MKKRKHIDCKGKENKPLNSVLGCNASCMHPAFVFGDASKSKNTLHQASEAVSNVQKKDDKRFKNTVTLLKLYWGGGLDFAPTPSPRPVFQGGIS